MKTPVLLAHILCPLISHKCSDAHITLNPASIRSSHYRWSIVPLQEEVHCSYVLLSYCFIVALLGNVIWRCNVAAGPVQEEVFENERFQPFKGWGHNWPGHFLPTDKIGHWSHRDGTPGKAASMAFSTVAPKLPKVRVRMLLAWQSSNVASMLDCHATQRQHAHPIHWSSIWGFKLKL